MKILGIFLLFSSLALVQTYAAEAKKIVLVAERHSKDGFEQNSLTSGVEAKLQLVSNSNFLSGDFPILLGVAEVEDNSSLTVDLEKMQSASQVSKLQLSELSVHRIALLLNGEELLPDSEAYKLGMKLLQRALAEKGLKIKKGQILHNKTELESLHCKAGEAIVCPKLGIVHLQP